jgi:hypothetical protein
MLLIALGLALVLGTVRAIKGYGPKQGPLGKRTHAIHRRLDSFRRTVCRR